MKQTVKTVGAHLNKETYQIFSTRCKKEGRSRSATLAILAKAYAEGKFTISAHTAVEAAKVQL